MELATTPTVHRYLTELATTQHADPVLNEMEARAEAQGFPIVGRAVGRLLETRCARFVRGTSWSWARATATPPTGLPAQ